MRIEYVFVKEKNDFCASIDSFKSWLSCNSRVRFHNDDTLYIDDVKYKYSILINEIEKTRETSFWVKINTDSYTKDSKQEALDLQKADDVIHRINGNCQLFSVNDVWDDVSFYYASKLYPQISQIERKIRKVIYVFMIKTVGKDWFKKNTPKDIIKSIKDNAETRDGVDELSECQLYYADFIDLIKFFTVPYSLKDDYQKMIRDLKKVDCLSKDELETIIEQYEKRSNWSRYFSDVTEFELSPEKGTELYKYRNAVAHNKRLRENDYIAAEALIKELNTVFEKCLEHVEIIQIDNEESKAIENIATETVSRLSSKTNAFSDIYKNMLLAEYLKNGSSKYVFDELKGLDSFYSSIDSILNRDENNIADIKSQFTDIYKDYVREDYFKSLIDSYKRIIDKKDKDSTCQVEENQNDDNVDN